MELLTGSNAYHLTHSICTAQDIVSRPEKPHSGRKEKAVGKNSREIAESYFIRISDGHKNAMQRPADPNVDRALRRMIEKANCDGDCIVNTGKGIFRPIPSDPIDTKMYHEYVNKDLSRARSTLKKRKCMSQTFKSWKDAGEYNAWYTLKNGELMEVKDE